MTEELNKLRAERSSLRRLFTLTAKLVETELKADPVDVEKVNLEFSKLADKAERLFAIDSRVKDALLSSDKFTVVDTEDGSCMSSSELDREIEGVEQYRDTWISIVTQRQNLLEKQVKVEPSGSVRSTSSSGELKMKLLKLSSREFDIRPETWIAFWAAFKKIHESSDMDPEDKFQLLLRMAKEGTVARELLDGYPPSAANYPKALAHLKQCFGRDELLIECNVRDLLGLVLVQAKGGVGVSALRSHCDKLESGLMALESLGVTCDKFACILMPLVDSSLPESVLRAWEKSRPTDEGSQLDAVNQMDQLRAFLKKTVISEERVIMAKSTFSQASEKAAKPPKKPFPEKKPVTAAGLVSVEDRGKMVCVFCSAEHLSEYCPKAREMSSESRVKILRNKKLCFKCIQKFHVGRRCKTVPHCLVCARNHASAMCSEPLTRSKVADAGEAKAPSGTEKNLSNWSSVLMSWWTLMGRIRSTETDFMLNVTSMCSMDLTPEELRRLDVIGIHDPADTITEEEACTAAREHFLSTVKRLDDGRYEISLPWLASHPPLPHGYHQAASRLQTTVKRLRAEGLFDEYDNVLKEWLQDGIIEEVPDGKWDFGHYLPHRAIVKEGSTTREGQCSMPQLANPI